MRRFWKTARKAWQIAMHSPYRRAAVRHRVLAAIEHERTLRGLSASLVVDIGANKGQFALVARRVFPNARIRSFEPLPDPAASYRNVFRGDPLTALHETAVGPESGTAPIHVSAREDSSSLLPITERQSTLFPGTAEIGTRQVPVGRLSDWLDVAQIPPDSLLKIDVQGFELEALKGCGELLARFRHVIVECSFVELYKGQALVSDVFAFMHRAGFALASIHSLSHDGTGRAVQGDFLYRRALPATRSQDREAARERVRVV
jgi:FkbM family methyltransferase